MIYHFKKGKPFIVSDGAPVNPPTNTFGDWIMSSSNNRNDWTTDAYSAFGGGGGFGNGWAANNNIAAWIQWQNTKKKVLVKNYSLVTGYRNSTTYGTSAWKLEGSDDGETWTLIDEQSPGVFISPQLFETGNTTPYYYHRLTSTSYKTHAQIKELTCYGDTYSYPTSSGFTASGKAVGYRSAKAAGCAFSRIPTDGLVFYAPLSEQKDAAETGQAFEVHGTPTYQEYQGIPCAYFNSSYLYFPDTGFPTGSQSFTLSAWVNSAGNAGAFNCFFGWGTTGSSMLATLVYHKSGTLGISFYADESSMYTPVKALSTWQHVLVTFDGTTVNVYFDGVLAGTRDKTNCAIALNRGSIGRSPADRDQANCYVAACRIYNRALEDKEIQQLAEEFDV